MTSGVSWSAPPLDRIDDVLLQLSSAVDELESIPLRAPARMRVQRVIDSLLRVADLVASSPAKK
jgi:hypothetical protein